MSDLGNKEIMAENIQYYMDKFNLTRNDMCSAIGVKYTTFTDWVNGNSYPRIDKIELMANYFGINKSDLIENRRVEQIQDELFEQKQVLFDKVKNVTPETMDKILQIVDMLVDDK